MGARSKRIARIRKAIPFAVELADLSSEMDSNWMTRRTGRSEDDSIWLPLPISYCPNSDDVRAVSNYMAAEKMIEDVSPFGTDYRVDLWPGGRILTLMIRADDAAAIREAEEIVGALESCGILDEEDVSSREWEANHPDEDTCHSDDEDCSCAAAEKRREAEYHEAIGHVQYCTDNEIVPELDGDSEWLCPECDSWVYFDEEDMKHIRSYEYRRDCWYLERAGQLTLI